ncbi:MAG TPA: sulfatase-like hydrolase/transferase [Bryobacteraceae bacterium]|jgi:choline-sulfatase|nr:sulfatase-like hydrolase/transferase [Bryobacteraceae bacterium]
MITRRGFVGSVSASALAGPQAPQKQRPNFLFLMADDHAGYAFGADGNSLAWTPSLDRLASEGVRFANHFCNSPMCTPSRQSLFTGQMPHRTGVTRLMTPLADDKPTIARQLRSAGYKTAVFGKMHFQRPPFPGQHGFDTPVTEYEVDAQWKRIQNYRHPAAGVATQPAWRPLKDPARIWLNADKLPFPRYYEDMKGTWIAREAAKYLEENRDRPFALWVSFMEPHSPFDFPVDDRNRRDPREFPVPRVGGEDDSQIPLIFRDLSEGDKQGINAAYYTSVSFLDRNIGVVLDKLRALGLDSNTFVVYTADHGYCLGHHGRIEKHCGYDPALRVPLIMRWPGRFGARVIQDLTEHVDLSATILDVMNAEPLPVNHGRSLRPYLETGSDPSPKDHIFSEYLENEEAYIRTRRHKFIYCSGKRARREGYVTLDPTPGRYTRLFDLEEDPGEFHDISRERPDLIQQFEAQMLTIFRQTHAQASVEPRGMAPAEALDWYLRPPDA